MSTDPSSLLVAYCLAIALMSLLGGWVPNWVRMNHTRTQLAMSLVAGFMLAVAMFHLLPHGIVLLPGPDDVDRALRWLMLGLVTMLLLLRLFHFHQHDFSAEEHHHHDHGSERPARELAWLGVAFGLGLHTLIDGVALGAALLGADNQGLVGLAGMGVFLAILLHKPLDAMSITALMESGGWSRTARGTTNALFALMCPLGALLFYFGLDLVAAEQGQVVGGALAFSAGAFLCIALSDLLPEVHFHSHDRGKLTVAFLLGIALAWGIGAVEPADSHRHDSGYPLQQHSP